MIGCSFRVTTSSEISTSLMLGCDGISYITSSNTSSMMVRNYVVAADPDTLLHGGERIKVGEHEWEVIWTPGHSPGHISFWRASDRVLICGDVWFNMNPFTLSPGLRAPLGAPVALHTEPGQPSSNDSPLRSLEEVERDHGIELALAMLPLAVPGLVPDEVFFDHLANRRFPSGNFIRKPHELDYLEEPDVFHDVFGHVPMLMNPAMADFIQAYGLGGLKAHRLDACEMLSRLYWYTIEFGLIRQRDGLRAYGAGILSSPGELQHAVADPATLRLPLDIERAMRTRYRIDDFQESYFVLGSLDELLELAAVDFAPLYDAARNAPSLQPGDLVPDDRVIHRGTGRRARRAT